MFNTLKSQKGLAPIIIVLIAVGVILLGMGTIYLYQQLKVERRAEVPAESPEGLGGVGGEMPASKPFTEITVVDETANLKTYRNEKYKYEIKAPKDWRVVEHGGLPLDLGMIESFWVQKGEYDPYARQNFLIVNVWDTSFLTTVDQFVGLGGVRGINIKRKEIILDQIPATEFTSTINENTPAACEGKQVFVKKDQLIIGIECASEKCDEIISTFKFVE